MKHIGWCLDKIQIEMAHIPRALNSQKDKEKANNALNVVQKYAHTLAELILHPKFTKHLAKLTRFTENKHILEFIDANFQSKV